MATIGTQIINIGPQDLNLAVSLALPAANSNATTGIIDLQAIAPNSDAWRLGRFAVVFPAVPENTTGAGITVALQAAPPSLTGGSAYSAPNVAGAGAFVTPAVAQTLTVAAVGSTGSAAAIYYMTPAFDAYGSPYQFYQFVITTPSGVSPSGETVTVAWVAA